MNQKDFKPFRLQAKDVGQLKTCVDELQKELSTLRVSKVSSGVASKLSKIKVVRKAIARSLTFINAKNRAMSKKQKNLKSLRFTKKNDNFPQRYFAIRVDEPLSSFDYAGSRDYYSTSHLS